ncbi:MAG: hypothetical protein KGL51_11160 [Betaproteobacteria bacterium]|nr:hypothetical protein [Betaproteobacteria bacterium]MDE2122887.1 hypothetical protein [Betaproteobacteria bacterium]MDE2187646.1 hypothetical protein [Betaproteobacteria bacterium]MDE2325207.1 hypothetical protein [Betaproteobacteria bacterium]
MIDLFSRQMVGWTLPQDVTRDLLIVALRMAWFKRRFEENLLADQPRQASA